MRHAHVGADHSASAQLRTKLLRELFAAERAARVHPRREAARLGDAPPAIALRAIADHAAEAVSELARVAAHPQRRREQLEKLVAEVGSLARVLVVDRFIDAERAYRATLVALKHGVDLIRLLHEVAVRDADRALALWCCDTLCERESLLADAEHALAWFAAEPKVALQSSAVLALR